MNRDRLQALFVNACGLFMLCVLPLLFRNAFFDINRFKVVAVCVAAPALSLCALLASGKRGMSGIRRLLPQPASCCMVLFMAACFISCARTGFSSASLSGSEGRYCGLYFLAACCAAFFTISSVKGNTLLLELTASLCAAAVAVLGVLNAAGVDPLGFYARIQKGQEQYFLSTIGNVDFFGAYLAMLVSLPMGLSIFASRKSRRILGALLSGIVMLGIAVSRTDVAFAALQMVCIAFLVLSGNCWLRMRRTLTVWSFSWFLVLLGRQVVLLSPFDVDYAGVWLLLCEKHIAMGAGLVLLSLGMLCRFAQGKAAAPGRKRLFLLLSVLLLLFALVLLAAMYFATYRIPEQDAAGFWELLRVDDDWGSRRGFVYRRSIRAYRDFSFSDQLFGRGLDLTEQILTPYFDDPDMLRYGVFNDAHCQPLQFLLTCGLFGSLSFLGFYAAMLFTAAKHAGNDPLVCGAIAILCGYVIIMIFSVTQPILIATYFSLCALALSRMKQLSKEVCHES